MRSALFVSLLLAAAMPAGAQSLPETHWQFAAGYDAFGFRDVARKRPSFDASSVEWEGSGPILTVGYVRDRPVRLHRFDGTFSSAGHFSYETGVGSVPRPPEDSASFLEGRYDYRRYRDRTFNVTGLQAGLGVRAAGDRRVLTHHFDPDIVLKQTDLNASAAVVIALRFRGRQRFDAELEWGNAIALGRSRQRHEAAGVEADNESWGAGWITDLTAHGGARITGRTAIVVSWSNRGEGSTYNLRSYASNHNRVVAGIRYAR